MANIAAKKTLRLITLFMIIYLFFLLLFLPDILLMLLVNLAATLQIILTIALKTFYSHSL